MARVLLLIPTASYRAPDFMAAAAELGVDVVVGSDQRSAVESFLPGATLALPLGDPEAAAEAIAAFAAERPLAAIVAVDDGGTLAAARASERLGLPHNPLDAVAATRDKSLLRARLEAGGVPSPPWLVASVDDDPRDVAARAPLPCVVKPLSLSGSRGVIRADDAAGFAAAFERLRALLADPAVRAECIGNPDRVLVEGYIPGDEVSVEGLLTGGELEVLAIFDKPDPLTGPYFEETIYVTPSRLPPERQEAVRRTAAEAARALGLTDGPLHAELRINDDGAWPVDIAARSIGGLCSRTLEFGAGVSLEQLLLAHAVGRRAADVERTHAASGVMMIPIPRAGRLRRVEGLAAARAAPGVAGVAITIPLGHAVTPLPEGSEYLGFIFARGGDPVRGRGLAAPRPRPAPHRHHGRGRGGRAGVGVRGGGAAARAVVAAAQRGWVSGSSSSTSSATRSMSRAIVRGLRSRFRL